MSRQVGVKKRRKQYEQSSMVLALQMVRNGTMTQRQAALSYGVPRTTLMDKLHGRTPETCRPGPPPAISEADERKLANHIKEMARAGFPYTRKALLEEVKSLLDEDGREVSCFKQNQPGDL